MKLSNQIYGKYTSVLIYNAIIYLNTLSTFSSKMIRVRRRQINSKLGLL